MKTFSLPNIELELSQICLGTNGYGTSIPEAQAFQLLDTFVAAGGNFLDSAHIYSDWIPDAPRSASEKTIGRWMQARHNRDQLVVGTKGGHPMLETMHISRLSAREIVQDLDESLAYLQTDYIDLYWLHRDDPTIPVGDMLETLETQRRSGKIRAYGCSNWKVERMTAARIYAQRHGLSGFVANQPRWHLAQRNPVPDGFGGMMEMDQETLAFHQQTGLAAIPYSSQAQGFFSKLDQLGQDGLPDPFRDKFLNPVNLAIHRRIKNLATEHEATVSQIALAYLLAQPFPTIPIIGSRTREQVQDSMKAAALSIAPEALLALGKET